jgi:hypothetical protein
MAETINLVMTKEEADQLRTMLDEFLVQIGEILERMEKDQAEIEQYRSETRAIIERQQRKAA